MADSAWVVDVTESDFEQNVLEKSKATPVVVDFWAPWCQPCLMLGPVLEKLAEEYAGKFLLAKVNVDDNPMLAQQFSVSGIPQVSAVVDGEVVGQFSGVQPEPQLRDFLDRLVPSEAQKLVREAQTLEETDKPKAESLYQQALESEPDNSVAKAALAEFALDAGDEEKAKNLLSEIRSHSDGWQRAENVQARLEFTEFASDLGTIEDLQGKLEQAPHDLEAKKNLGLVLAAKGQFEQALDSLVQVIEADREYGGEHVRPIMVKIFNIVGQQSDLANTYRSRLASALY